VRHEGEDISGSQPGTVRVERLPDARSFSSARRRLLRSLDLLDALQNEVLSTVADVPPEALSQRPNPAAWSVAEVLDHLIRVETSLVRIMRGNLTRDHRTSMISRLRNAFVQVVMYSPIRVRMPTSVSYVAPRDCANDVETLARQWRKARQELKDFLAMLSDEQLEKGLVKHPVAGWMSAHDCVAFSRAHLHHHTYQLARLRAARA
jgi:uncharacterized damage-inducible protein DinB